MPGWKDKCVWEHDTCFGVTKERIICVISNDKSLTKYAWTISNKIIDFYSQRQRITRNFRKTEKGSLDLKRVWNHLELNAKNRKFLLQTWDFLKFWFIYMGTSDKTKPLSETGGAIDKKHRHCLHKKNLWMVSKTSFFWFNGWISQRL